LTDIEVKLPCLMVVSLVWQLYVIGCAAIWWQFVLQLYGSCYYTVPSTLTQLQHSKPCGKLSVVGRQFPTNNIKLPTSFELVNNQYIYYLIRFWIATTFSVHTHITYPRHCIY